MILKNLWIGLNQNLTYKVVVCFIFYHIGELVLLKNYICFLIVVSGVFFVGYILDKILKRMVVVCLIFEKMLGMCPLLLCIYL